MSSTLAGPVLVLILSTTLNHASGKVYHIKPSPSLPCPAEPCLILSQFVHESHSYLESNTTLIFLPGKHKLKSILWITNVNSLSVYSHSSRVTITCKSLGRFDFSNIHIVHVQNLTFIGCAANKVRFVHEFILEDSNFIGRNTHEPGRALELLESTARINRNSFISYSNSGKYHFIGSSYPSVAVLDGGAIMSQHSNINITESRFERNSAIFGGAIFSKLHSSVTIINTTFKGNVARLSETADFVPRGGVVNAMDNVTVTILGCRFINNSATDGGRGGVLSATRNVSVSIVDSHFISNTALGNYGKGAGVLYAEEYVSVYISFSQFVNNTCDQHSGVADVEKAVDIIITGSHFTNNRGALTGVLHAVDHANIAIMDSQFLDNIAIATMGR